MTNIEICLSTEKNVDFVLDSDKCRETVAHATFSPNIRY